MLKDTLRLSFGNSSNIWKILLYRFLCLLCVLGLTTVIAWPIINVLIKENFFTELKDAFENMLFTFNFEKLFLTIDNVFKSFASIISSNGLTVQAIISEIFVVILALFLEGYAKMAVHQSVYGYMSSLTKYGFTNGFVANFGKATLLNLTKIVTLLPLNILIWGGAYLFASKLYAKIGVFAIILTFLLLTILVSLKNTFFAGWLPASIVHAKPVFASLKLGVVAVCKKFLISFSSFLIFTVGAFILNIFALVFTAGVGLLVTLPITTLVGIILGEVIYFDATGMRYYVDSDRIITPKRLEERDSFSKVKDII